VFVLNQSFINSDYTRKLNIDLENLDSKSSDAKTLDFKEGDVVEATVSEDSLNRAKVKLSFENGESVTVDRKAIKASDGEKISVEIKQNISGKLIIKQVDSSLREAALTTEKSKEINSAENSGVSKADYNQLLSKINIAYTKENAAYAKFLNDNNVSVKAENIKVLSEIKKSVDYIIKNADENILSKIEASGIDTGKLSPEVLSKFIYEVKNNNLFIGQDEIDFDFQKVSDEEATAAAKEYIKENYKSSSEKETPAKDFRDKTERTNDYMSKLSYDKARDFRLNEGKIKDTEDSTKQLTVKHEKNNGNSKIQHRITSRDYRTQVAASIYGKNQAVSKSEQQNISNEEQRNTSNDFESDLKNRKTQSEDVVVNEDVEQPKIKNEGKLERPKTESSNSSDRVEKPERPKTESSDRVEKPERPKTESSDRVERQERPKTESSDRVEKPERPKTESSDRVERQERPRTESSGKVEKPERPKTESSDRGEKQERPRTESSDRVEKPERPKTKSSDRAEKPERPRTESSDRVERPEKPKPESSDRVERQERPRTESSDRVEGPERPRTENSDRVERQERPKSESSDRVEKPERPKTESSDRVEKPERPKTESSDRGEKQERPKTESSDRVERQERPKPESSDRVERPEKPKPESSDRIERPEKPKPESSDRVERQERPKPESSDRIERPEKSKPESSDRVERSERPRTESSDGVEKPERPRTESSDSVEFSKSEVKDEKVKENTENIKADIKKIQDKYKISDEELEAVIKNVIKADIPLNEKNIETVVRTYVKAENISDLSNKAILSVIREDKPLTVQNVYVAEYMFKNDDNVSKKMPDAQWKQLEKEVLRLFEREDIQISKENVELAKLFIENEVPITKENISKFDFLKDIQNKVDLDNVMLDAAENIKLDKKAEEALLFEPENDLPQKAPQILFEDYKEIIKVIPKINTDVIKTVIDKKEVLSLENLKEEALKRVETEDLNSNEKISKIPPRDYDIDSKIPPRDDKKVFDRNDSESNETYNRISENTKDYHGKDLEVSPEVITAKRQLAEIQLKLTTEASLRLAGKGIDINVVPIKKAVEELRELEKEVYKSNLKIVDAETSTENVEKMSRLFEKVESLAPEYSNYVYRDIITHETDFTIDGIDSAVKANFDKIMDTFDTFATTPSQKFGDTFASVFDQIPHVLEINGISVNDENIDAAKILSLNDMDITESNILQTKSINFKVVKTYNNLHPLVAAEMIKEGLNPVDMNIDDVISYIDKFDSKYAQDSKDQIAENILRVSESNEISRVEKDAVISVYRMLDMISKHSGAAIGTAIKNNVELTLGNLMEASKIFEKAKSKRDFNLKIDDKFGLTEDLLVPEKNIRASIEKAMDSRKQNNENNINNSDNLNDESNQNNFNNNQNQGQIQNRAYRQNSTYRQSQNIFNHSNRMNMNGFGSENGIQSLDISRKGFIPIETQTEYTDMVFEEIVKSAEPSKILDIIKSGNNPVSDTVEKFFKSLNKTDRRGNAALNRNNADFNKETVKAALEQIRQISDSPSNVISWLNKNNVPVTMTNFGIAAGIIKNPHKTGKDLEKFERNAKESKIDFGSKISSSTLDALKNGKSPDEVVDELIEEVDGAFEAIIETAPTDEIDLLLKQASNIKKALSVQSAVNKNESGFYQLPVRMSGGNIINLNMFISENGINQDNRTFMSFETENLGVVQVYMNMSQRDISLEINSEYGDAARALSQYSSDLRRTLEDSGFNVRDVKFGQESPEKIIDEKVFEKNSQKNVKIFDNSYEIIV